jgi:hypothetical protein
LADQILQSLCILNAVMDLGFGRGEILQSQVRAPSGCRVLPQDAGECILNAVMDLGFWWGQILRSQVRAPSGCRLLPQDAGECILNAVMDLGSGGEILQSQVRAPSGCRVAGGEGLTHAHAHQRDRCAGDLSNLRARKTFNFSQYQHDTLGQRQR